ncbi:MAG TPA: SDR family oxidoreductase [Tepidisphaeraceae bacterium]|nr:SDR family oxidoreductase [Tepidisphaeraceae bacterium]
MPRNLTKPVPSQSDDSSGIAGKSVVLNGGTTGIGLATAKLLAMYGARVLLFGRDRNEVAQAVEQASVAGGEVYGLAADVTRQREVIRVFKEADRRFGGQIDVLINNAATAGDALLESDYDTWRKALDTNILGYLHCAREALDRMRPRKDGHILMVGSMSADLREPTSDIYSATKAAIQALCESLRKNVNEEGIRVTLIEPGAVDTPMQDKPQAKKDRKKQAMEMLEADDIAECIRFALSQPKRVDIVSMQVRPLKQLI